MDQAMIDTIISINKDRFCYGRTTIVYKCINTINIKLRVMLGIDIVYGLCYRIF